MFRTLFFAAFLLAAPSMAHAACYSPVEVEAEQGIRIHSELMVIGLTCQKMPGVGGSLYAKYLQFTRKNQSVISLYESNMINYYRKAGFSNPEKGLIDLRTGFANSISKHAVQMSMVSFCKHFGTRVDQALQMDTQTFRQWARHVWPEQPTTVAACR